VSAERGTAADREERAELEVLRDEADRIAEEAARTVAELTERLSPRNVAGRLSRNITARTERLSRDVTARLGGKRAVWLAATILPVAVALAAAAVAARHRPDAFTRRRRPR
jgi:hypothetical protein